MKKLTFILLAVLFTALSATAQVAINKDDSDPDASALLDVKGTDAGILIPRMTALQRDAINPAATGLMVYVTDDNTFYYYNGTQWVTFGASATAGDDHTPDFWIDSLYIRGTDTLMVIKDNGNVGIGTTTPESSLNIGYDKLRVGSDTASYWTDLNKNILEFNRAGNWSYIDQSGIGGSLVLRVSANNPADVRAMIITSNGYVGMGTMNPNEKLEVNGSFRMTDGSQGDGKLMVSDADGTASWADATDLGLVDHDFYAVGTNNPPTSINQDIWTQGSLSLGNSTGVDGAGTFASGLYSFAGGYNSDASGAYSFAFGRYSSASGTSSFAFGIYDTVSADYSFAFGQYAKASGLYSYSFGTNTQANADYSTALGVSSQSYGDYSFVGGYACYSSVESDNGFVYGYKDTITGKYAPVAMGYRNKASGNSSVALGTWVVASGACSFAVGTHDTASGYGSVALGRYNTASGSGSFATGVGNTASGTGSVTLGGEGIEAAGNYSFAIALNDLSGSGTVVSQNNTMAIMGGNVGIGTTAPARKLHVTDAMRLDPLSAAPATPSTGDMYMDDGTNTSDGTPKLMVYNGTTWKECW